MARIVKCFLSSVDWAETPGFEMRSLLGLEESGFSEVRVECREQWVKCRAREWRQFPNV